jgi:hypothetical protein
MGPVGYGILLAMALATSYLVYLAHLAFQRHLVAERALQAQAALEWSAKMDAATASMRAAAGADQEPHDPHALAGLEDHEMGQRIHDRRLDQNIETNVERRRVGGRIRDRSLRSLRDDGQYTVSEPKPARHTGWSRLADLSDLQRAFVLSEVVGRPRCLRGRRSTRLV